MRYSVISKKAATAFIFTACIMLCALFAGGIVVKTKMTAAATRRLPIYCVKTDEKKLALTFDCAWEASDTDLLLDILTRYNVPATFFVTGDFCERHKDTVERFFKAGHAIENHSYKHPHVASIEKQQLIDDTLRCDEIITSVTGKKPTLYRAPYGEYDDDMMAVFEKELTHKVIQWDADSVDWQKPTVDEIVWRMEKHVKAGSILLFHNDLKKITPPALEVIIPKLQAEGYQFVLVEDLLIKGSYTIDHTGMQISAD